MIGFLALTAPTSRAQAPAQPSQVRGYVLGGFTLAVQPEEQPRERYLSSSDLEGVAGGLHVGAGVHLTQSFSLAGEVSLPARVSGERRYGIGSRPAVALFGYRDVITSGVARWHFGNRRWQVGPVAGVSWVYTDLQRDSGYIESVFPPGRRDPLAPLAWSRSRLGLSTGVDVVVHVTRHLGIAPFARLHWVNRVDPAETDSHEALPPFVYRFGVALAGRW